jgi:ribonuclease HI
MKHITVNTDASYKNKKASMGAAIKYGGEEELEIIYGNMRGKTSQQAELIGAISGLEYVFESVERENGDYFIELRTDQEGIVNFIENRLYLEWDKVSWVRGNSPICSHPREWYKLMLLCKGFGLDKIKAVKVNNKNDVVHRIAHFFARLGLKENSFKARHFKKLEGINLNNYQSLSHEISDLYIEEFPLDRSKSKMPWCLAKREKKGKDDAGENINWLEKWDHEPVEIEVENIYIHEPKHLASEIINFRRFAEYHEKGFIDTPIAVKRITGNRFSLVMGISRLVMAKALGIKTIPTYITEHCRDELLESFGGVRNV